MMYFLLILFFGSLVGITFMIGKKLAILQNGQISHREETISKEAFLEEWKYNALKNIRKYSYFGLVASVRFYLHFSNFLKIKYQVVKTKIKNNLGKKSNENKMEKREASNFLKMISEYKYKIRKIKYQIKKEEEGL
jgi:hypothetical protein